MPCEARSAGRGRLLPWAMVLLAVGTAPVLAEEEILLNLPREFDVTARRPWLDELAAGIERPSPLLFRFRGERFRATTRWVYHSGTHVKEEVYEGIFQRGRLEGTWEGFAQVSYAEPRHVSAGCPPLPGGVHFKEWESGRVTGTATPEGLLSLTVRVTSHRAVSRKQERDNKTAGCYRDLGWVDVTRESETEWAQKWAPYTVPILLRLPVGEPLSSQKLSTPSPTRRRSPSGDEAPAGGEPAGAPSGEIARPEGEAGAGSSGPAGTRQGARGATPGAAPESPWSVPVSPGAAAGAGAAVALTSLLGALWMFGTSGLSPGDLLGSAPEVAAPEPPAAEALSPRELFVESHRDGDVNPDSGEVWSESVGGWVGSNFHELERRRQAEIRRAQGVSDRESCQESARIAEELRASRKRGTEAARRGAQAAEEAVCLEAPTIEPYQPGWTDHATKGLEWAEWGIDTSMSVLAGMTGPGGEALAAGYTTVKETTKGMSEGVARWTRGRGGHLAGEGSAGTIVERATIGLGKGVAKVWMDKGAGHLLDRGLGRLAGAGASQALDLGEAALTTVARGFVSATGEEARRTAGIALGRALASPCVQSPGSKLIEGVTGEKM